MAAKYQPELLLNPPIAEASQYIVLGSTVAFPQR